MSKNGLRDIMADSFVKALEEDRIPWRSMWSADRAYNATTDKDYRGLNAMWLSYVAGEKGYTDPRWCTFQQAKEHGWHVKKGEKGSAIEFWSVYDTLTKKTITLREADEITSKNPERKDDLKNVSKTYFVFNAQQIEGIPQLAKQESVVDVAAIRSQRDVLLGNMHLTFHEGGNRAYYNPTKDSVSMPESTTFENDYAYMATFLHECGHATAHESRLNRPVGAGGFGSSNYAKEELRAEIASAFTAQALGFGAQGAELSAHMQNHRAYVQSWIQAIKDKPSELFAAIKDAEKISDYLLEKGEFQLQAKREVEMANPETEKQEAEPLQEARHEAFLEEMAKLRQEPPRKEPVSHARTR